MIPCDCCPTGGPLCATDETGPVFPCRRSSGVLEWYNESGTLVPSSRVYNCSTPLPVSQVTMEESALGDDPVGNGERVCNVVPPVSGSTGYTVVPGPCYDGSPGADTLTWSGPLTSISMSYESGGGPAPGAALLRFMTPSIGLVTWPANGTPMTVGQVRRSNALVGGGFATLTYLAPAGAPASGAPHHDGGANIRIGPPGIQPYTPYHFRIDFWAP